jgi:hypothetical protein
VTALIRPTSASEAVQRALCAAGPAGAGITYQLLDGGGGGRDPWLPLPTATGHCDCSGFACWASGFARHQPDFAEGGDIFTDAALLDADHKRSFFEEQATPLPGDWIVYGSANRGHAGGRVGHVGVIVGVPNGWRHDHGFRALTVVQCAAFHGRAIRETDGAFFDGADSMGRPHNSRILRPTRYIAAPQPAHELVGTLLDGLLPALEAQHGLPGAPDARAKAIAAVASWASARVAR